MDCSFQTTGSGQILDRFPGKALCAAPEESFTSSKITHRSTPCVQALDCFNVMGTYPNDCSILVPRIIRCRNIASHQKVSILLRPAQVRAVREWAARTLQVPEDFIEPLQLVRYTPGQKFGILDANDNC